MRGLRFVGSRKVESCEVPALVIDGAGHAQLFMPGRVHTVIDGYTTAPAGARPDMYRPVSDTWPDYLEVEGRENSVGLRAVGVPGTLAAWCEMLARKLT